jgi:hypothetical protein
MTAQSVQYDGIMHDFTTTSTASAAGRAPTGRPGSRAGGTSPRRDRSARAAREDSQEDGRKRAQDKQRQNCRPLPLPRRADLQPFPRKYQRLRKNKDSRHSPLLRRPLPPPGRAIVERPSPGHIMVVLCDVIICSIIIKTLNVAVLYNVYFNAAKGEYITLAAWVDLKAKKLLEITVTHIDAEQNVNLIFHSAGSNSNAPGQIAPFDFEFNGQSFACSLTGLFNCISYCGIRHLVNPAAGVTCDILCGTAFAFACSGA